MKKLLAAILAACATITFVSCDETTGGTDEVDVTVPISIDLSQISTAAEVVVEVTGPGIGSPLAFNLTLSNGQATGEITLPTGQDRTISVYVYDAAGIATHSGQVTVDIREGQNPALSFTLEPLSGDLPITVNVGAIEVFITPAVDTLSSVGDTVRLSATVVDTAGDILTVSASWASLNPQIASVDTGGVVTATGFGSVQIVATYAGVGGAATIVVLGPAPFTNLQPGDHQTCGLRPSGDVYCWGSNLYGQLGDGTNNNSLSPVLVTGGNQFDRIDGGGGRNCGMTVGGEAYCWGRNNYGSIGDSTTADRNVPVPAALGVALAQVSTGNWPSCGVTSGGVGYCWGWGGNGERGDSTISENQTVPAPVAGGLTWDFIQPGGYHTCGIASDGSAFCWGNNSEGQLGTDSITGETCYSGNCSSIPLPVQGGMTFDTLATGGFLGTHGFSCGLTNSGVAYCWGDNTYGQLGDNTTVDRSTPAPVATDTVFVSVSAYGNSACGLAASGNLFCWGSNLYGQLGLGTNDDAHVPTLVGGEFLLVETGLWTTCGIKVAGDPYCWGRNDQGQVGDGTTTHRTVPTRVVSP